MSGDEPCKSSRVGKGVTSFILMEGYDIFVEYR